MTNFGRVPIYWPQGGLAATRADFDASALGDHA
jgi:hypothetical protein